MRRSLESNFACRDVYHFIASETRNTLVKYITENDINVGFMIDESTTVTEKEARVLCRVSESADASSFCFDVIELDNKMSDVSLEMIRSNIHRNGHEEEFLLRN